MALLRIGVIGCGYIGLVSGAALAGLGHQVICMDRNRESIELLKQGRIPFFEPGLSALVNEGIAGGRLEFSADLADLRGREVVIIAVGTPAGTGGEVDLTDFFSVVHGLVPLVAAKTVIVIKSTVLPGTARQVEEVCKRAGFGKGLAVVSNPEFLREGSAVGDFFNPDRIVLGGQKAWALTKVEQMYKGIPAPVLTTDTVTAELIKYASNTFLAAKISFINEMARICQLAGGNVGVVAEGMGLDKRIGRDFLQAGVGFGGSCLPKDTVGLLKWAEARGYQPEILRAALEVNLKQRSWIVDTVRESLGVIRGKTVTILGLSFKPDTGDTREAPALDIIGQLLAEGAVIRVYDPAVKQDAHPVLSEVAFCRSSYEALVRANCGILLTEWEEFKQLDFCKVKKLMDEYIIIDGRNCLEPQILTDLGFKYYDIGRFQEKSSPHSGKLRIKRVFSRKCREILS